jgi:hypothetical protein
MQTHPAEAQGSWAFPVYSIACDALVTASNSASGEGIPPDCRGIEGVTISAYSTNSDPLDSCTTGADGFCALDISPNGTRIFRQDELALPEGYVSWENVKHEFTYTEFAEIWFHSYSERVLPQRDAPRATVRVNTRVCPDLYAGDDFFEDCNPNLPEFEQWVFGNDQVANAGSDGNAVLRYVPAATESQVISGYDLTTGDVFFYCSLTSDPESRVETSVQVTAQYDGVTRDFVGFVDLEPGMDVTCDWYQIPGLDRGLWTTLVSPLAGPGVTDQLPAPAGDVLLTLRRCPVDYIPETISGARETCTSAENNATVRAVSPGGSEYDSGTTSANGMVSLSMSGVPFDGFWISLDGHADAVPDLVACYSVVFSQETRIEPIQQWATFDGEDGWTIDGYGDDAQGYTCDWYLVPTGT